MILANTMVRNERFGAVKDHQINLKPTNLHKGTNGVPSGCFSATIKQNPLFWLSPGPNKNSFKDHFLLSKTMFHENRKHAPLRKNHNTITQNLCFSIHDWSRDGRLLLSFNSTRDFALR
jgi:hypothetical protein